MPKYQYLKLRVTCSNPKTFHIDEMREAVDYLRTVPQALTSNYIGLIAEAVTVSTGRFKLKPEPMLTLHEITGKSPRTIWEAYDAMIDESCYGLEHGTDGYSGR